MKQRILLLAAYLLFICGNLLAQAKLVEKVTKKNDEVVIPYEKYILPNVA